MRSALVFCIITSLALRFNWNAETVIWSSFSRQMTMADSPWIIAGYRLTPHPIARIFWLTGPWIETVSAAEQGKDYREFFRPLASVDLWLMVWVGLTHGFLWVSAWTLALFLAMCALSGVLAWRLTRSEVCGVGAAAFCTGLPVIVSAMPSNWIAWFPVQQDLLMLLFLLGALIGYDRWKGMEGGKIPWVARACVLLGCLTKEYDYALALMVPLLLFNDQAEGRRLRDARARRRECIGVVALSVGLAVYRQCVLPHPSRPAYAWWSWTTHPLLDLAYPYYVSINGGVYWLALTALSVFFLAGAAVRTRAWRWRWVRETRFWLTAGGIVTGILLADVLVNHARLTCLLAFKIWYFVDPVKAGEHGFHFLCMISYAYTYLLVVKYRHQARTLTVFGLMALAYLPVVGLDGFHYWLGGGMMRAVFWPLIVSVAWMDVKPLASIVLRSAHSRVYAGLRSSSRSAFPPG